MERLLVSGPSITQKEISYVTDAVTRCWYGNANLYHDKFEKAFAEYVGRHYAIALPSCTSAIHLSLLALGVGPGDEVIVPDITWIASAAPIHYVGAVPVFADIDPKTWCISAESFESCITSKTKVVIPVDLYGNMPDMDRLYQIAQKYGITVIEDAAEAIGSEFNGKRAGGFGDISVFSFHGSKTLTTGEGGMLLTDQEDIYQRALILRDHGRLPGDKMFFNSEVAYKYKMSSMQAALGLAQLERIEELIARKREIFAWYAESLSNVEGITLNYERLGTKNTYWMITAILDSKYNLKKEALITLLDKHGIDSRPFFFPLSSIPAFANHPQAELARQRNKISYALSPYGINLPSGLYLTQEKVNYVANALKEILKIGL